MAGAVQIQNDCCGPVSLPSVGDCTDCCTTSGGPANFWDVDLTALAAANTPSCGTCTGLPGIYRLNRVQFTESQCNNIFARADGCCWYLFFEELCGGPLACPGCGSFFWLINGAYLTDQAGSLCYMEVKAGAGFVQQADECRCIQGDIATYRSNTFLPHNCRTVGPRTLNLVDVINTFNPCTLTWPASISVDTS